MVVALELVLGKLNGVLKTWGRDLVEARIPVLVRQELESVELGFHNIFSVIFTLIITGLLLTYTIHLSPHLFPQSSIMTLLELSIISIDHHLLTHFIEHVPQVVDLSFSEIELEEQFTPVTSFSEHEKSPINLGVDDPVNFDTGIPRAKAYAFELA